MENKKRSFVPVSAQRLHMARHLHGYGVEIGGLHRPLRPLPAAVQDVLYVDSASSDVLRSKYPELNDNKIVFVKTIADGQQLPFRAESLDFIVANHFIEHVENVFTTLEHFWQILKPDGILYLTVPEMRQTLDKYRKPTTYEHLRNEYLHGAENNRAEHYRDWVRNVLIGYYQRDIPENEVGNRVQQFLDRDLKYHHFIHLHAWRFEDFVDHIFRMRYELNIGLEIIDVSPPEDRHEFVIVMRKITT